MTKEVRGRTVLLLEDEGQAKTVVRQKLESAGYKVLEAANGLRLVSRLHVDKPDVVVMNTARTWTDCFDLCQSLKHSERFKGIRVVVMTDQSDLDERARTVCCDRLITQPASPDALLSAIDEILKRPGLDPH